MQDDVGQTLGRMRQDLQDLNQESLQCTEEYLSASLKDQ